MHHPITTTKLARAVAALALLLVAAAPSLADADEFASHPQTLEKYNFNLFITS